MTGANQVFEDHAAASIYDDFNPWSAGDDFYLGLAREDGGRVLDLGCGTGMLACRIAAEGFDVTGADPAAAMLRVARARPGADKVAWVRTDGQSMDLGRRFDLIYMTGHAFQALLTDADVLAVLATIVRHLAHDGRFAFETRNPAVQAWLRWTPAQTRTTVETAEHGRVEQCFDAQADGDSGIVAITQCDQYLDTGEQRTGHSRIRFISQGHVAQLLAQAGLMTTAWYGDWDRKPFTPTCREIIAVSRRSG
ncbi:MAG TPA: class I SAM-dependent methyltransferase [Vineibacter sp.]|nr:class I SAM-dependent methyltransferase [Vineibacter sp.]